MHRRVVAAALAVIGLCAATAAGASAAPVALGGSPLNVYVDQLGQLQAFRDGQDSGIYFPDTSTTGDAGFFLAVPGGTPQVFGFNGFAGPRNLTPFDSVSQGAVTVSGTTRTQVTTYRATAVGLTITQTTTYVDGSQEFGLRWDVGKSATGPASVTFKPIAAADFFFDGSDRGTGIYTQGPPQFIGGTNADTGNSGGFVEVLGGASSPWFKYQALAFGNLDPSEVWYRVVRAADDAGPVFDDTVVGDQVDNAGAVEWANTTLSNGQSARFEIVARTAIPSALQLNPTNAGAPKGVPINITATALDTSGRPYAGRTLRYAISGANNVATGQVTLDAAGTGVITDPGTNACADTVVAFVDFNNNGTRETAEPQASAPATFVDSIPPSCSVKVSGDRPGGSGGAGKPLIITVNCNEPSTVTVQTTLTPRAGTHGRAATFDKKTKAKKKVAIKLKTATITMLPGQKVPVALKLSSAVRKKYAGKTLTATITVTARDASGNVKKTKATRTVKLAKLKRSKAHKQR
jgi:hypothetical protein